MGNEATGSLPKDSVDYESFAHPLSTSTWAASAAVLGVKFPGNKNSIGIGG